MKQASLFSRESSSGASAGLWARTAMAAPFLVLACVFAGCSSDDDAGGDNDGAGAGGAAGAEPAASLVALSWMVRPLGERVYPDWITEPGLQGVEVCLIESIDIPCVYTDEQGVFELPGVPTNSELLLTFTKEGYVSHLVSVRTGWESIEPLPGATQPLMFEKSHLDQAFDASGVVRDEDKGHVLIGSGDYFNLNTIPGRLSPSISPPVGEGPLFFHNNTSLVPEATGLSEEIVFAIFANLDKGEYVISWEVEEPENMSCAVAEIDSNVVILGLPAEQPDAIRVKVRPGFLSGPNVIECPAADPAADAG